MKSQTRGAFLGLFSVDEFHAGDDFGQQCGSVEQPVVQVCTQLSMNPNQLTLKLAEKMKDILDGTV